MTRPRRDPETADKLALELANRRAELIRLCEHFRWNFDEKIQPSRDAVRRHANLTGKSPLAAAIDLVRHMERGAGLAPLAASWLLVAGAEGADVAAEREEARRWQPK